LIGDVISYMDAKNRKTVILVTGGTILCSYDSKNHEVIPNISTDALFDGMDMSATKNQIIIKEFSNIPSPHLSFELGAKLLDEARTILADNDVTGLIIVQGTDVLEEVAYLFHLVLETEKPVVFTGSMKNRDELYSDYKGNIDGAIKIIESGKASSRGVMVYFNQEIHSAKYVEKENSNNMSAFKSPRFGAIGVVNDDKVDFFGNVDAEKRYSPLRLNNNVQLIRATYGMNDLLIRTCIDNGVPGIVVEGLGSGNVPPNLIPTIKEAIEKGIAVVLTSRCHTGHVITSYGYEGGGAELGRLGAINGGNLSGIKARIKLVVLMGCQRGLDFVRAEF